MPSKRKMVLPDHDELSVREQCQLIQLNRSSYYYEGSQSQDNRDSDLANVIHDIWVSTPFYGYRRITETLRRCGYTVNHKRVQRIMNKIGIEAIYPKKNTSQSNEQHKKYPYLLKNIAIVRPNQVFATDITYLKLKQGFMYLLAILDLYSRYIVSWRLSNTMDTSFCLDALDEALSVAIPDIFNTDQGSQFTSDIWTEKLKSAKVKISMDGKGHFWDNILMERFWRTIKYEDFYLNDYDSVEKLYNGTDKYIQFYNFKRPHQSLNYLTPNEVYSGML